MVFACKVIPLINGNNGVVTRKHALKAYRQLMQIKQQSSRAGFRQTRSDVGTKKSLKDRLLSPTTGKPFSVGAMGAAGAAAIGVGGLCFYGLGMSGQVGLADEYGVWPQYVRDRVHNTYKYLGASLAVTAGSAVAASRSPAIMRLSSANSLMAMFGTIALIVGSGALVRSIGYENVGLKHVAWIGHTAIMGAVLAPLTMMGGPHLLRAAWYTAGMVGGLSAVAVTAPSDKFMYMGGALAMGFGVVFASSLATMFLPPTTAIGASLASISIYGGLVLFGGFLLYDTQRVFNAAKRHPTYGAVDGFDPINAQLAIYMDILNIFIRLAMILGGGGSRRK